MPLPAPPPDNLNERIPLLRQVSGKWYRVVPVGFTDTPIYFGNHGTGRFDSPDSKHGVCYLGKTPYAAFSETLLGLIEDGKRLRYSEAESRELHELEIEGDEDVYDLTGRGLLRLGATLECFTGSTRSDYGLSQCWARKLMVHPVDAAGIHYFGRQSGDSCIALFGRCGLIGAENLQGKLTIKPLRKLPLLASATFHSWLDEGSYTLVKQTKA